MKKKGGWSRRTPPPPIPLPPSPTLVWFWGGLEERKRKGCTDLRAEEDFKSECL